ncbi:MAG: methyltransferase domain-containing protein, partial [Mariprofundus sp.]|nr:methyltransferase domain-containing protein [Mariprofundus sp.]
ITAMLNTYANESRVSVALIMDRLQPGLQLLEVGAGLCFTSLFLKAEGYQITALEPALGCFGMFEQLKNAILKHHTALQLKVITVPAQQLDRKQHGQFDLIFSNNVIEHIPDWQTALTAMTFVLSGQGSMVHACPNYSVPYEPHYGVPVFRRLPGLSRLLFLSSQADAEIWDSLNFITCKNIRNYCNSNNLIYCFKKELLYNALKRIDDDPLFKERHQGFIAGIATFVMRSGLGELIRYIPPAMATPMIVEISKRKEAS